MTEIHILKMSYRIFSVNQEKKEQRRFKSPKFSLNLNGIGGSHKPIGGRTAISNIYMNDVISARD